MTNNFINNLSLRFKLILFLIIPVITILYFSGSSIFLKLNAQEEGQKSLEFILISFQIDDVIHELQKERGISAGYIGSQGKKLREELIAQRTLTDRKIRIFAKNLSAQIKKNKYPSLSEIKSRAKVNQKKLADIRKNVDTTNKLDFFQSYSELIASGINIIRHFQVITSNITLARQSRAYTNLLLLQERSGQERGLLNGIFALGKLDAKRFKFVAGYISEQEALLKDFYAIASKDQQALLTTKLKDPRISDVIKLRTAAIHKATRNDKLNGLQSLIGYGGLIHNFKNYIIRGNQKYADNFKAMYIDANNIIKEYKALPGISGNEISSLNIIKSTFYKYNSFLEYANNIRRQGHTINEVDYIVKVDDQPALDAIKYLHENITGLDTTKWWEKASLRIELIREVSNKLRVNIKNHAHMNLLSVTRSLYINLILTIASLLISFLLAFYFIRYLVGNIINIETHMSNMRKKSDFDKLLKVKGNDELGKLTEEFNNLIEERVKFEEELLLAAAVFEKSSEGMVITDKDNHFLMINPAFTRITGYSFDEIKGKTPAILNSGTQDKNFYKDMWSSLKKYGHWAGEIINRRKNGDIYPEWLNVNVIFNNKGEITRHIAMFSDITDRKYSEEKQASLQRQLMQSQKMESLGQLTGGIAHDFNNMLSAILGYTDLAMELGEDKESLQKYLKEVFLAGNRAKELVARMLAFSRGSKDIEVQQIDIGPLLNESVEMIRPLLPSTIEFESHIVNSEIQVLLNPVMINQVIMNLCINARDAIGEHGKIIFSSKIVSIDNELCTSCHQKVSGDFIEVSVHDTGSGIKPENMNNLFEPFFSTKEMGSEKGTGMGLAMVHGIVHDHKGHIIVESDIGEGSTFRLLFPCNIEHENDLSLNQINSKEALISDDEISNIVKERNILIVDDEESLSNMMRSVLESYNCKVTIFLDSQLALQHFKENTENYDLIITDQTMPKLTGAELSKSVLELRQDIPIIMCTGHSENVNRIDADKMGIAAYMEKPVKNKELLMTVAQLLGFKDEASKM